jgi:hypothetical protein
MKFNQLPVLPGRFMREWRGWTPPGTHLDLLAKKSYGRVSIAHAGVVRMTQAALRVEDCYDRACSKFYGGDYD